MKPLRISFDIGGVLSKYPHVFRPLVAALNAADNVEVYVVTDMHDHDKSVRMVQENGYDIPAERVINSDYARHGEQCKEMAIRQHNIDIHVDDFPGYVAHTACVNLFVWPNPREPYFADDFKTDGSEGNFGRRTTNETAGGADDERSR